MVAGSNPAVPTMFFSFIYQHVIDHQTTTLLVLSADPLLSRPFSHSSVVA